MATRAQDHKTPRAQQLEEAVQRFEDIDGHDLLIPFSKVKGSDQLRLMSKLVDLGLLNDDANNENVSIDDLDLDKVADLIDYVAARFAVNESKFDEFTMGPGGFTRAMNLAVAYAGELGKGNE